MKKLLVLLTVLGVASFANAAIVVVNPDPATVNIQTDPISAVEAQQALFLAVEAGLQLGAGKMLYAGTLSAITDFTADPDMKAAVQALIKAAPAKINFIELFDGTVTPPPVTGRLATYPVVGGAGNVYLLSDTLDKVLSSVYVPEPVTLVLLGLGGLFLRRRK